MSEGVCVCVCVCVWGWGWKVFLGGWVSVWGGEGEGEERVCVYRSGRGGVCHRITVLGRGFFERGKR